MGVLLWQFIYKQIPVKNYLLTISKIMCVNGELHDLIIFFFLGGGGASVSPTAILCQWVNCLWTSTLVTGWKTYFLTSGIVIYWKLCFTLSGRFFFQWLNDSVKIFIKGICNFSVVCYSPIVSTSLVYLICMSSFVWQHGPKLYHTHWIFIKGYFVLQFFFSDYNSFSS